MKVVTIKSQPRDSMIMIGERLTNLAKYMPVEKPIIITDIVLNHCGLEGVLGLFGAD